MSKNHSDLSDLASNKRTLRFFWGHVTHYPLLLWGMIFTVPVAMFFNRFLPSLITAGILDRLSRHDFVQGDIWGSFGRDIVLAVASVALGGIFIWRLNGYFNWKLEGLVVRDISQRVFDHLMELSANFHANNFGGSLVSQTNKLANAYVRITDTTIYQISTLLWGLVFTSVILWSRAPLFVLLLIIFTVVYIICSIAVTGKVRHYTKKEAEAENRQTGQLADSITNVMAVKSFATSGREKKRFAKISEETRLATMRVANSTFRAQYVFSSIGSVVNAMAIIVAVASVVVYDANIATVFLVFSFTSDIRQQLWEFSNNALRNYNRAFGDAQSMAKILAMEPSIKDPTQPEKLRISKGAIDFEHMSFTHSDNNDALFENLQLRIQPGEKIGLVGHSGSGKTTLTKLLLRFNDVDGGGILIDGQNIASVTQDDLRSTIAYVPQEPLLFHRSIRENISYGKPDATQAEILAVAKKAHATEFVEKLPNGYETLVGERGVKLSGGQRQRIAIARAMLKDAPILVLDEATSALDSESEVLIQDALWKLMEGRTAIVIAHRLSTVQKLDRIVVLDDGKIAEEGNHKQLLRKKGTYASLWKHQSGGFLEE